MTLAISTSSPLISVSVFSSEEVLFSRSEMAQQNASGLVASWVAEAVPGFSIIDRLVVDIGPGGFTGVKVGVTMAQMFAISSGVQLIAVTAFDLISSNMAVAIPYKKGSYCVRELGQPPVVSSDLSPLDYCGYGIEGVADTYPSFNIETIEQHGYPIDLTKLVPLYIAEPSISTPKQPFASL